MYNDSGIEVAVDNNNQVCEIQNHAYPGVCLYGYGNGYAINNLIPTGSIGFSIATDDAGNTYYLGLLTSSPITLENCSLTNPGIPYYVPDLFIYKRNASGCVYRK